MSRRREAIPAAGLSAAKAAKGRGESAGICTGWLIEGSGRRVAPGASFMIDAEPRTEMPPSAPFRLVSDFEPKGDQPEAIRRLVEGLKSGAKHQVLLG